MKKLLICLSAIVAGGAMAWNDGPARAQMPPVSPAPAAAPQPARPRIALVNIAKVMREFAKAKSDGEMIMKERQNIINQSMPIREKLADLGKKLGPTANPDERARLTAEATEWKRKLEDLEQTGGKRLNDLTDQIVVEVYHHIKMAITDIAVTNNLDLVMVYPDSSAPEDERKPAVVQMKLQTPALYPLYHRNMDITEVVIATLNKRHPAPAVTPAAVPPMGGAPITPVSGRP